MDQPQLLKIKWNKTWQHISEGSNATIIPNTPSFNFFKELFISITNKWLATLRRKRSKQIIKRGCYLHCAYCLLKYFIGESRWIATNNILSCPHCLTRNLFNKDAFPSTAQQRFMTSLPLCTIVTQTNPNPCLFFFFLLTTPPDFSSIVLHATAVTTKRKQQTPSCYKALACTVTH